MKLNETAAGVCLGQIFQSVAALQNTVHSDLRGLGVVGIEHIGGEIFGWSQLDQAAQAVGHAPGVHRLISGELPDLSGSEAQMKRTESIILSMTICMEGHRIHVLPVTDM